MLSRDDILRALDLRIERVEVPEWNGYVFVKTMTARERAEWESIVAGMDASSTYKKLALMVASTVCDESGQLLFTADDVEALQDKNGAVLLRLGEVAIKVNVITAEDIESLSGNSGAAHPSAFSSNSPAFSA
jgi:hypothetical protein